MRSKVEECLELLVNSGRIPEAAFMARTYLPSAMGDLVSLWKKDLAKVSTKASQTKQNHFDLTLNPFGTIGLTTAIFFSS